MARKQVPVTVPATKPKDKVSYQQVGFRVNETPLGVRTVGPLGGRVLSDPFDVLDDETYTVTVTVVSVDAGGKSSPTPAVEVRVFEGPDTTPPDTPEQPTIEDLVDAEGPEAEGTDTAGGGGAEPAVPADATVLPPAGVPA